MKKIFLQKKLLGTIFRIMKFRKQSQVAPCGCMKPFGNFPAKDRNGEWSLHGHYFFSIALFDGGNP